MGTPYVVDWSQVFGPDISLFEIFVRGTIIYLTLYLFLRLFLRREAGALAVSDLLVIVLIADAAQNGMSDQYDSIVAGVALVATIVAWSFFLDWLSYKFPRLGRWIHSSPAKLIENGEIQRRNMRREFITVDELMGQLRLHGVEDISEVKLAYMESDGRISVIRKKRAEDDGGPDRRQVA